MAADGGKGLGYNDAGAKYGTGYCDALLGDFFHERVRVFGVFVFFFFGGGGVRVFGVFRFFLVSRVFNCF